jgi:hypothetical protein
MRIVCSCGKTAYDSELHLGQPARVQLVPESDFDSAEGTPTLEFDARAVEGKNAKIDQFIHLLINTAHNGEPGDVQFECRCSDPGCNQILIRVVHGLS